MELDRYMLFVVNDDTPGMIGRLGTILGEAEVNIANMAVSRNRQEARALMALSLDSPAPESALETLAAEPGFVEVRFIVLPGAVSDCARPRWSAWPRSLREARVESRIESIDEGTATAADAATRGWLRARADRQVAALLLRRRSWVLAMVPGDRRADRAKIAAAAGAQKASTAGPDDVSRITGYPRGRRRAVPAAGRPRRPAWSRRCCRTTSSGSAPARRSHVAALTPADLVKAVPRAYR